MGGDNSSSHFLPWEVTVRRGKKTSRDDAHRRRRHTQPTSFRPKPRRLRRLSDLARRVRLQTKTAATRSRGRSQSLKGEGLPPPLLFSVYSSAEAATEAPAPAAAKGAAGIGTSPPA